MEKRENGRETERKKIGSRTNISHVIFKLLFIYIVWFRLQSYLSQCCKDKTGNSTISHFHATHPRTLARTHSHGIARLHSLAPQTIHYRIFFYDCIHATGNKHQAMYFIKPKTPRKKKNRKKNPTEIQYDDGRNMKRKQTQCIRK